MSESQKDQLKTVSSGYQPTPKKRRGNRRATGGSAFTGPEPTLAGLTPAESYTRQSPEADDRDTWLKEQLPPHYGGTV
ncbi:hypothetical protein [Rothia nasimurium]|uniref:hypothetical protein n=1 Tax=Rothia nasimurium TaxID=85336 RepID=UPI003B9E91A8